MKKNKWIWMLTMAVTFSVLIACNNDDDDEVSNKTDTELAEEIIGVWRLTDHQGWSKDLTTGTTNDYNGISNEEEIFFILNVNKTGYNQGSLGIIYDRITWSISDKILLTKKEDGSNNNFTVNTLDEDHLILISSGKTEETEWYNKYSYNRVR